MDFYCSRSKHLNPFVIMKNGLKFAQMKSKLNISVNPVYTLTLLILLLLNLSSVSSQRLETRSATNAKQGTKTNVVSSATDSQNKQTKVNEKNDVVTVVSPTSKGTAHVNCSLPKNVNLTICKENSMVSYFLNKMSSNSGMLFRTMYVLLAVTGILVVYFVIKAIRLRRRRSKTRKYGIITKQGDRGDMEMEPLGDGMDEDDDYTVFEMSRRK